MTAAPVKKKGSKKLLWIIIIVVGIVIIGGGTVAFLQYKGTVNIPFLSGLIPSTSSSEQPAVVTNYYVVHSFASTGSGKWEAIVSAVFSTQTAYNNEEGAKNAFKKAVMKKYPKDSNLFTNSVLCVSYNSLPEAQSGRSGLLKNYTNKKYDVRSVDVIY